MRPLMRSFYRAGMIGTTALALSFVPTNARAQETSAQDSRAAVSGQQDANANLNAEDADRMDQFLQDHKDIDKDLKKDPSLVTSKKYLDHHKEFRSFLEQHPRVQGEFARNPNYFTQRQDRLAAERARVGENAPSNTQQPANSRNQDRDQDADAANSQNGYAATNNRDRDQDRDRNLNGRNPNPGERTGEAARLDEFLDSHQQIDRDLTANPSLANNNTYLDQHQDLRTFLNDHPDLREQFSKNPSGLMQAENRFDARARTSTQDQDQDRDRDARVANSQSGYAANNNPDRDRDRDRNLTDRDQDRDRDAGVANSQNGYAATNNPDRNQDRDRNLNGRNPNPGERTGEAARLDEFLDSHQQIDRDLTANPSLANNNTYLDQHQDLRTFLNDHPDLREQFSKNPSGLMQAENRFDARARTSTQDQDRDRDRDARVANSQSGYAANNNPDRDQDRDRNLTDRDQDRDRYANGQNSQNGYAANNNPDRDRDRDQMNQFLGDHKDIDKDLSKNPSLVNDQKYLGHHRDLRSFFDEHPQARREFAENPSYFMGRDERFERGRFDANRNYSRADLKLTDKQAAQMDRFLDKHQDIDRDLSANPSLCRNDKYLHQHKDLRAFFNKNPEVRAQLVSNNSAYFAQRHERMEQHNPHVNRAKSAKPAPNKKPEKTPVEQHETTAPTAPR